VRRRRGIPTSLLCGIAIGYVTLLLVCVHKAVVMVKVKSQRAAGVSSEGVGETTGGGILPSAGLKQRPHIMCL
jgi:hypothetical protein